MRQVALDHVGVVARDLAAVAAQYEQLGFRLTPLDQSRGSATLDRFLARYTGVHILAFSIDHPSAELARPRVRRGRRARGRAYGSCG